jgi:hypothetical protein
MEGWFMICGYRAVDGLKVRDLSVDQFISPLDIDAP